MKEKLLVILLFIFAFLCTIYGQQSVSGRVIDSEGVPIIGATVLERGTSNGTISNIDGLFTILASPESILEVSFIGYMSEEIEVGQNTNLSITLYEDIKALDEIVVIGYGTARKIDLSGSVSNVDGEKLSAIRATSVSQALQGSMPGVQITRSSSMPGASATIRVRGVTTIGDSDPLIIVDGVPGSLSMDVEDIESISVLKDAASASIYGARAASGVILVTTKRGKEGTLNVDYSGTFGIVKPTEFPGVVNYRRYMEMINEIAWNDGGNVDGNQNNIYYQDFIDDYAANNRENPNQYPLVDWTDYLIKKSAPTTKHNVSTSYGNNVIQSRATLGYETTDALYNNRDHKAMTARMNNDLKINDYLSATVNASYRRGVEQNTVVNPLKAAYLYAPLWSPVWSDGRISDGRDGTNTYARVNFGGFDNSWNDYLTGKFAVKLTPVKNFVLTGVYAPTIYSSKGKRFVKQIPYYDADDPTLFGGYIAGHHTNSLNEARGERREVTKQLLANYSFTFDKRHDVLLLAGYEDYSSFSENLSASSDEMELSEFPYLNRGNLAFMSNSGNAFEYAYSSLFGRVNYDFSNKYLIQANIRLDKSSRFHKDYRQGVFPSISAGWVLSEEAFMKKLNFKQLSFFKLRGSWGRLGNERIGNYPYQSIMSFSNVLFVDNGGYVSNTTASQRGYNIKNITWETTESWNVGIDASFFDNKLTFNADYYNKNTRDMLLTLKIPGFMGYDNPDQNAGKMNTRGWDLQIDWRDRIGELTYSLGLNMSDYKSEMGNLSGTVFDGSTISREGSQYNEWYGYLSDGLFLTQEDLESSPVTNSSVKVGDVKYVDVSGPEGIPDGMISPEYDRVLLGGSLPRFIYGGNFFMDFKNFDLGLTFQGVGQQNSRITSNMVWQDAAWHTFPDFIDGDYFSHYNSAEKNANVRYPRISQLGAEGNNYIMSDFWLFNGSYFRLKNFILGYTMPSRVTDWLQVSKIRVFVSATDLFSIDNYPKGWDPEVSTSGSAYISRTFNAGVSIKF